MSKSGICRLKITIDTSVGLARGLEDVYSLCNDSYLRFGNDINRCPWPLQITVKWAGSSQNKAHSTTCRTRRSVIEQRWAGQGMSVAVAAGTGTGTGAKMKSKVDIRDHMSSFKARVGSAKVRVTT